MTEYPTSFRQQAQAAHEHLRTHPRLVRLTPGQRDRIVREVRAERAERAERDASSPLPDADCPGPPDPPHMDHDLSAQDDGREVRAAVGDRLVVRLPENGGTGFLWTLDVPAGLALRESAPEPAPRESGVGGTGLHRFVLEVTLPERSTLSGRTAQPWAPDEVDATWSLVVVAD